MSSTGSRYQRTFPGLIGAILVTLLAIGGFVGFRAMVRDNTPLPPQPVDWTAALRFAHTNDFLPAYPTTLPEGSFVRDVEVVPGGDRPVWDLDILTEDVRFLGIRQEVTTVDRLVARLIDERPERGEPVTIPGAVVEEWRTFRDGGRDYALVAELEEPYAGQVLIVYGTAGEQAVQDLAASLTFERR